MENRIKSKKKTPKIEDARFNTQQDPRFKPLPKKEKKVEVDPRFQAVFTEKFAEPTRVGKSGAGLGKQKAADVRNLDGKIEDPVFEWNQESSSESEQEESEAEVDDAVWEDEEAKVPRGEESRRLAIMNADWDTVTADDLFVLLHSNLEGARKVEKVTVYPSDYGVEKMKHEAEHGPQIDDWEEEEKDEDDLEDDGKENTAAIRRYQKQRLKYYYAVAEFDSAETGAYIYDQLDGLSIDHIFPVMGDFRFIPDDVEFKNEATSEATSMPENYEPLGINKAMSHSKVKCTWDETKPQRKAQWKKLTNDAMADIDMQAYLASSSESELDENNLESYRDQLLGSDSEEDAAGDEMSVSFNPDLEKLAESIKGRALKAAKEGKLEAKMETQVKTPWAKYLEKKAAQKAERKGKKKDGKQEDSDDDMLIPSKKDKKKKKHMSSEAEQPTEEQLADLALVAGDDEKDFDLNNHKKTRKQRLRAAKENGEDTFEVDVKDNRLSKFFENPDFAIDPTNPAFHKTPAMTKIITEKAQRRKAAKSAELEATRQGMKRPVVEEDMAIFKKKKRKQK